MFPRIPAQTERLIRTRQSIAAALLVATALVVTACGQHQPAAADGEAPAAATGASLSPPIALKSDDRTAVDRQVAGRLRLEPAQIRTQLDADPNATLMVLAKQQGLAQDQLAAAILAALNDRADASLRSGAWTAEQATQEKQFWMAQSQPDLIAEISRWFRAA